ncbi:hypothetical protein CSA37_05735 [Candidatus Fermentibacteria bacterium]|nr:MAG: hypothetical protein CSA37_13205 [Candidatus Fermentibacteria bacterium]PIE52584.1 MAG: hypothetical protein CSA37_05735 [Candidatus Fermentibacteria bacterium]
MKIYWKVYLMLVFTTLIALVFSLWISFSALPARMDHDRKQRMDRFQESVMSGDYTTIAEIKSLADSMSVEIRMIRPNNQFPPGSGGPGFFAQEGEWRGLRLIVPPFGNMHIIASVNLHPPRFFILLLVALGIFTAQAAALAIALRPVARKLSLLTRATDDFGKGKLTARYSLHGKSDELDRLGKAFNTMAERINSLLSSHNELLNSVAHELRTPMTRLGFAIELARENPENSSDKLKMMEKDLFELDRLVSELIDFNRIGGTELSLSKVDMNEICREAAGIEQFPGKTVAITVNADEETNIVEGDPQLLLRAVSNLVRNAVFYAASSVSVNIHSSSSWLVVTVKDDGPGFSPGFSSRAVRPFVKGEKSKGIGLGLSIVQRIAEKHKGRLSLGNSLSGSAVAELSIPK